MWRMRAQSLFSFADKNAKRAIEVANARFFINNAKMNVACASKNMLKNVKRAFTNISIIHSS